jgi:dihydroflavonol-4-reductase
MSPRKKSSKVLVTGAGGFIGSAVVRKLLEHDRDVRCLLRTGEDARNLDGLSVEIVRGDVLDREAVGDALAGCDTLYHLAAIYALWLPDPSLIYEVNIEGSKNVLWAAWKAKLKKVVYTSSIAAVGQLPSGEPSNETVAFNRWDEGNAYIRSKWLSERDALRFAREGLPVVVVNPAFPFGERDTGPTPTGRLVLGVLGRKMLGYLPGGFCVIDVDDVAAAHVLAERKGRVGERYILGNHNITYREFYQAIAEVGGVRPPAIEIPPIAAKSVGRGLELWSEYVTHKHPMTSYKAITYALTPLYFDGGKARKELGMPVTPLRKTVEKSVGWFRAHGYA